MVQRSKKWVLFGSITGSALLVLWDYIGNGTLCTSGGVLNESCLYIVSDIEISLLLPIFSLTLFAFVTFWMRKEVYRAWFFFACGWTPLSIVLAFITPESGGGGFGPSISFGKGDTAFITSVLFILVSIGIIIVQYIRTRRS